MQTALKYAQYYDPPAETFPKGNSPIGTLLLTADSLGLTGIWYTGTSDIDRHCAGHEFCKTPILNDTKKWLDTYFSGAQPQYTPLLHFTGSPFLQTVCRIMCTIPYGKTMTYKEIAHTIAVQRGIKTMSAQAVGGAAGRNPISIIVPCHRVIGTNGTLTGYGGGIARKHYLLALEQQDYLLF